MIKEQVVKEVRLFFDSGVLPKEWNYTHLCVIPKFHNPKNIADLTEAMDAGADISNTISFCLREDHIR